VDPLTLAIFLIVGLSFVGIILLGLFYPGSGAEQVDWKQTRSPELEASNEIDDLAQMESAVNAKRRARGVAEISHRELKAEIEGLLAENEGPSDAALAAEDLRQMLEARNARRRARGEAEESLEEFERSLRSDGVEK